MTNHSAVPAKLGDYAYFVDQLELYSNKDMVIKHLHTLMFGTKGDRPGRVRRLQEFICLNPSDLDAKLDEVKTWPTWCVSACLKLFGKKPSSVRKNAVSEALIQYLARPLILIEEPWELTPVQIYVKAEGKRLRLEWPDVSTKSIESIAIKQWNQLTTIERESWRKRQESLSTTSAVMNTSEVSATPMEISLGEEDLVNHEREGDEEQVEPALTPITQPMSVIQKEQIVNRLTGVMANCDTIRGMLLKSQCNTGFGKAMNPEQLSRINKLLHEALKESNAMLSLLSAESERSIFH